MHSAQILKGKGDFIVAKEQKFSFSNISKWPQLFKKLPKRQKQAVYMVTCCCAAFLVTSIVGSFLILSTPAVGTAEGTSEETVQGSEAGYDKDENTIDAEEFDGVILPLTADAGLNYINDTVFVGDSNTVRLNELYDVVSLNSYMGMVGMTVQGAVSVPCVFFEDDLKIYTIPDAIEMVKPRRIILTFGTNDAGGGVSVDTFINNYETLISTIQSQYEYTDIIVGAIPPCGEVRDYPNVSQETIDQYNKALVTMCEELGLPFLNTAETFKDPSTGFMKTEYISADGLHINEAGARAWLTYARTHALSSNDERPDTTVEYIRQEPPAPVAGTPVLPTCTENGYTPYTLWDGSIDKRNIVEKLGHDFVDGICTRCSLKDPDYIPTSSEGSSSESSSSQSDTSSSSVVVSSSSSVAPSSSSSVPASSSSSEAPSSSSVSTDPPPASSSEASSVAPPVDSSSSEVISSDVTDPGGEGGTGETP